MMKWLFSLLFLLYLSPVSAAPLPNLDKAYEFQQGQLLSSQFEMNWQLIEIGPSVDALQKTSKRLLKALGNKNQPYTVTLVKRNDINAFSFPNGRIYVTKGLINYVQNQDELAFVIAHEIGHQEHGDFLWAANRYIQQELGKAFGPTSAAQMERFKNIAGAAVITSGYGVEREYWADAFSLRLVKKAKFNPKAGLKLFQRLLQDSQSMDEADGHPSLKNRADKQEELLHLKP
ncbi:M48 family metallopeptidase [Anaeromusa acidaminophila]|uniref:M48 family metallopeptidase n=1 Tax=Anaeromusa acidaminophila TaxID=81464 RepID=UPI000381BEB7|nr:M48 family metallopeptidase [Anaeromusa acidaminophila]